MKNYCAKIFQAALLHYYRFVTTFDPASRYFEKREVFLQKVLFGKKEDQLIAHHNDERQENRN